MWFLSQLLVQFKLIEDFILWVDLNIIIALILIYFGPQNMLIFRILVSIQTKMIDFIAVYDLT